MSLIYTLSSQSLLCYYSLFIVIFILCIIVFHYWFIVVVVFLVANVFIKYLIHYWAFFILSSSLLFRFYSSTLISSFVAYFISITSDSFLNFCINSFFDVLTLNHSKNFLNKAYEILYGLVNFY